MAVYCKVKPDCSVIDELCTSLAQKIVRVLSVFHRLMATPPDSGLLGAATVLSRPIMELCIAIS